MAALYTSTSTTLSRDVEFVYADATGGSITLTLPDLASARGQELAICREDTVAGNSVTVARAGSDTIDGGVSVTVPPRGLIHLWAGPSGTNWRGHGQDAQKLDDLAAADDNTDLNASTSAHGLLRKLDGLTTTFLRGDGTWATPAGGGVTDAEYLVAAAHAGLSAERVTTDTATVAWDHGTGGQAKANVPDNAVSDAKLRDSAALSVVGRASNSTGDPADIAASADGDVLRRAGTTLGFGAIPEASVTGLVTDLAAKVPTSRQVGTTAPLTGGGALSGDLTLGVSAATTTAAGVVELATDGESAANLAVQANDARLSNARTPTAHAASHKSGGSDAIKLDELAAPTDVTTLNASTSAHGLFPKLPGGTTNFWREDGSWQPAGGGSGLTHPQVMARTSLGF